MENRMAIMCIDHFILRAIWFTPSQLHMCTHLTIINTMHNVSPIWKLVCCLGWFCKKIWTQDPIEPAYGLLVCLSKFCKRLILFFKDYLTHLYHLSMNFEKLWPCSHAKHPSVVVQPHLFLSRDGDTRAHAWALAQLNPVSAAKLPFSILSLPLKQ